MSCPKCKARIGVMKHEIVVASGVVECTRCIICGYWSNPVAYYKQSKIIKQNHAAM